MNKNLPKPVTNGFVNKIKDIFRRIFGKKSETVQLIAEKNEIVPQQDEKPDFLSNLQKQACYNAIVTQEKLDSGDMRARDLSDEEYNEVVELYKSQIKEKEIEIMKTKQKLAEYNKKKEE